MAGQLAYKKEETVKLTSRDLMHISSGKINRGKR